MRSRGISRSTSIAARITAHASPRAGRSARSTSTGVTRSERAGSTRCSTFPNGAGFASTSRRRVTSRPATIRSRRRRPPPGSSSRSANSRSRRTSHTSRRSARTAARRSAAARSASTSARRARSVPTATTCSSNRTSAWVAAPARRSVHPGRSRTAIRQRPISGCACARCFRRTSAPADAMPPCSCTPPMPSRCSHRLRATSAVCPRESCRSKCITSRRSASTSGLPRSRGARAASPCLRPATRHPNTTTPCASR